MHGDQDCLKPWIPSNVNRADGIISLASLLLCGANWFVLNTFIHAWERNKTKHSHIFPGLNPLILLYRCILRSLLPSHMSRASQNLSAFLGLETCRSSALSALLSVVSTPIVCSLPCALVRHLNHTDFAVGLETWCRVLKEGKIKILVCQHFQNIWSCKFPNICSQMLLIINLRTVCQHDYILNSSASCEPMQL